MPSAPIANSAVIGSDQANYAPPTMVPSNMITYCDNFLLHEKNNKNT